MMIGIGVIGLGGAGRQHVQTLKAEADVAVRLVADVDADRAKKVAAEFGVEEWTTDFNRLFERTDIEAVTVATPPFLRGEVVIPALRAGKHVLCEKPLARTVVEAETMVAAGRQAGVKAMVNFGPRNLPVFGLLRELIGRRECGRPRWCSLRYFLPATPEVFMPPAWFWQRDQGGGHLVENGGHLLDFLLTCLGPVKTVCGAAVERLKFTSSSPATGGQPDIEDLASLLLRHESGAITSFTNGCITDGEWGVNLEIQTEYALICLRQTSEVQVYVKGKLRESHQILGGWDPIPHGVRAFVRLLRGEDVNAAGLADGLAVLRLVEQCYQAAREGHAISI